MARPSKLDSPNQLWLDFEQSRDEMKDAVDKFSKAAAAVAEAHENPETETLIKDEVKEMREVINRLVGVLASQTGMPFHAVWVLAYHELHQQTGFHAVAASGGKGTHLDAVQEAGRLPDLQKTVTGMLADEKINPKKA